MGRRRDRPAPIGRGTLTKRQIEPLGGQQRPQPLGPFDQTDAVVEGVLEAELIDRLGALDAVQIEMPQGEAGEIIILHQGETGAGNLHPMACEGLDHMARQGGFPGAEHAAEPDKITSPEQPGQPLGESSRGVEVGKFDAGGQISFSMVAHT